MKVLVTGGAGYIGSVVTEELLNDGHQAIVYDNLYKGHRAAVDSHAKFVRGDLNDSLKLRAALTENQIDAVIHMAADSLVGESVEQPAKYYRNNIVAGLNLLALAQLQTMLQMTQERIGGGQLMKIMAGDVTLVMELLQRK